MFDLQYMILKIFNSRFFSVRNIAIQEFKAGSQNIRKPLINLQTTQEGREAVDKAVSAIVDKCIELSKGPLEELSVSFKCTIHWIQ